jgi:integrase
MYKKLSLDFYTFTMKKLASELLSDLSIKSAKPKGKQYTLRDGGGLFVLVHPNGSKYFQLRTTLHGKPKLIQIGSYPLITLSEARIKAREKKKMIKVDHTDPILDAKLKKYKKAKEADATFKKIAEDWLSIKADDLAPSTLLKIKQTFNSNVYREIGNIPIRSLTNDEVRACLLVMQKRGALEFMDKTRGWIKRVFDFALSDGLISENPIPIKDERLKKHSSEKHPHFKNIKDAGYFLRRLEDYAGSFEAYACVLLQMHFAQRPSELRESKWLEFDLEEGLWELPLPRSKTRKHMIKPHKIMLSKQSVEIIKKLKAYSSNTEYLFSTRYGNKPICEATVRKVFRTLFSAYRVVPHGCRHFFSTQANESAKFRNDVIESFLSHKDKNEIRSIYNEAEYLKEKKELAQWWSDELDRMRNESK